MPVHQASSQYSVLCENATFPERAEHSCLHRVDKPPGAEQERAVARTMLSFDEGPRAVPRPFAYRCIQAAPDGRVCGLPALTMEGGNAFILLLA